MRRPQHNRAMDTQQDNVQMAIGQLLGTTQGVVTRLEEMNQNFQEFRKEIREDQKDLRSRLVDVERFMWKVAGISAASATVIPILISVLVWMNNG